MNFAHKVTTIAALAAALGLSALAATPASAYTYSQRTQLRQADRLNHAATVAANHGHFRKAAQLHRRAAALRAAVRHGY